MVSIEQKINKLYIRLINNYTTDNSLPPFVFESLFLSFMFLVVSPSLPRESDCKIQG